MSYIHSCMSKSEFCERFLWGASLIHLSIHFSVYSSINHAPYYNHAQRNCTIRRSCTIEIWFNKSIFENTYITYKTTWNSCGEVTFCPPAIHVGVQDFDIFQLERIHLLTKKKERKNEHISILTWPGINCFFREGPTMCLVPPWNTRWNGFYPIVPRARAKMADIVNK